MMLPGTSRAEDEFWSAVTGGKLDFAARYRYEHVDDDAATLDADASTIRTTLGYTTGKFNNFGARLLLQDVRAVVMDDFNDGTGRNPVKAPYAVVADPSDTDYIEGYISYSGIDKTTLKLGRQIITYRGAPFHRFIGTVAWRQNWQNQDAVTIQNKSIENTTISYAYSWNVNRIFTDNALASARANFNSDSHLINLQYDGFKYGRFEGYAYLLDFSNAVTVSTATYGIRFNGSYPLTEKAKLIYTGEYAMQDDYADNPASVDEDYILGEIGVNFQPDSGIQDFTLKLSYEILSGNGTSSFQTPLATAHAYQGWTDRFLATPGDGLEDFYITASGKLMGANLLLSWHMFESDNLGYDYGDELDIQVTKTFKEHYTFGFKFGLYDSDRNAMNIARGGNRAADVSKYWAWAQVRF